jgi:Mg2+/Co2+ transporter CorB
LNEIHLSVLAGTLVLLIILSAFFSGSETGMMALNRYRLRHLANEGDKGARRASALLARPDRLIGVILLGNNFVNILASAIATVIALELLGEKGIALATVLLTLVVLIFAEVAPKTLAALNPERIAFPASFVLGPLLKVLYPLVWVINMVVNGLLRLVGIRAKDIESEPLSREELRTVVNEAGAMIPRRHRRMLVSILDLEDVSVEDIMVPRNEVSGIDLEDPLPTIRENLTNAQHTRLPLFEGELNHVVGLMHVRRVLPLLDEGTFSKEALRAVVRAPYFVPASTPLHTQLINFQRQHRRVGLVVDEYGDIQGLVTLEDILEEIVGEFTSDPANQSPDVTAEPGGTYLVNGGANIRELNRTLHWQLPAAGPKTLNGLIIEYLEVIPEPGTSLRIAGYPIEVISTTDNAVKTARISPALRVPPPPREPD